MKKRRKPLFMVYLILLVVLVVFAARFLENKVMPVISQMSEYEATNRVNTAIDYALVGLTDKYRLTSGDFVLRQSENYISADTVLINKVCSEMVTIISNELIKNDNAIIKIPFGMATGFEFLANHGPDIRVEMLPMGVATIDYNTSFVSAGINQINFQVWLDVSAKIKIVNPLSSKEISLDRKISLVNIFVSGSVPTNYYNGVPIYPQK